MAKNDSGYIVYHIGNHVCTCKLKFKRPTNLVSQAISQDPMTKPTKIQSNAIIAALREKEPWDTVLDRVSAAIDEKVISNEKIKQNKKVYNFGASFDGVVQAKSYFDEKDKYLIYNVDESAATVFKTSNEKMKMAHNLDQDNDHFLNTEFIFFDEKVKRTKHFITLKSSIYHSLLRKQVALATMECPSEDLSNVVEFWKLFHKGGEW